MSVVGIDLAGSERRNTGFCVLRGKRAEVRILHSDSEILGEVEAAKPSLIGIDAPLSLPAGRKRMEDREGPKFRECDLELRRRGIRFFPIVLGPMRKLTERGRELAQKLRGRGYKVVEVYPGATFDISGVGRKDRAGIRKWIRKMGYSLEGGESWDELDSAACAITAKLFKEGKAEGIGNEKEGEMIIPKG